MKDLIKASRSVSGGVKREREKQARWFMTALYVTADYLRQEYTYICPFMTTESVHVKREKKDIIRFNEQLH